MSESPLDSSRTGGVLSEIDPDLTIFALANGLDLLRDPDGHPARVLEWYSEKMERRIVLTPAGGPSSGGPAGALDVAVAAEARLDGAKRELRRSFRTAVAPGQLKATLPEAIEAGNALTRSEVEAEGHPR